MGKIALLVIMCIEDTKAMWLFCERTKYMEHKGLLCENIQFRVGSPHTIYAIYNNYRLICINNKKYIKKFTSTN